MNTPNRVPPGTPTGGRFAPTARAEAEIELANGLPPFGHDHPWNQDLTRRLCRADRPGCGLPHHSDEGAAFCVWQPHNHKGAQVVNEHGSLNFNTLLTRDPDAAEAFYGAVFGWRRLTIPAGVMWTLPGYGDHLEEATPGLREQMAQMGAPEGFIDVVAALTPVAADGAEPAAQWSVTFAVNDVAATAAKVRELGGEVVSGPLDAPWARLAMINDPQGAGFIASQFISENKDISA